MTITTGVSVKSVKKSKKVVDFWKMLAYNGEHKGHI